MSKRNVAVIEKMWECFRTGDNETLRGLYAADVSYRMPGNHPIAGTKWGIEELFAFFGELGVTKVEVDVLKVGALGEDMVLEMHHGHGGIEGARLDIVNCNLYLIQDGKIAKVDCINGDQHHIDDFFNAIYRLKPLPDRLDEGRRREAPFPDKRDGDLPTSADSPVALVQKLDDACGSGDFEVLRNEVFAPEVKWDLPGRNPLAGPKRGVDEVVAYLELLGRLKVRQELVVMDRIDDETVVKVYRASGSAAGADLDSLECTHYQIRDGRITQAQTFVGNQHPVDLFYWRAARLRPIPGRLAPSASSVKQPARM